MTSRKTRFSKSVEKILYEARMELRGLLHALEEGERKLDKAGLTVHIVDTATLKVCRAIRLLESLT